MACIFAGAAITDTDHTIAIAAATAVRFELNTLMTDMLCILPGFVDHQSQSLRPQAVIV
jgi:hypothetical protein